MGNSGLERSILLEKVLENLCAQAESGTDISTSPLAPASEFLNKRAFGQVHFSFHLPE